MFAPSRPAVKRLELCSLLEFVPPQLLQYQVVCRWVDDEPWIRTEVPESERVAQRGEASEAACTMTFYFQR